MSDPQMREFKTYDPDGNLIAHGATVAEAFAPLPDSAARAEAEQLLKDAAEALGLIEQQEEHAEELQQRQLHHFVDGISRLSARMDTLEQTLAQKRADAEEQERAAISAAEYSLPPGSIVDEDEPEHEPIYPSGDLHALEGKAQLAEDEEDPGPVPLSYGKLPLSYVKGAGDEGPGDLPRSLTEKIPPSTGTETEFPGPRQPTARDPVGY